MTVIKQKVEIKLNSGINQKAGDKFLQPGELTDAVNVRFDEDGTLHKRYGVDALSKSIIDGATMSEGSSLIGTDTQLLAFEDMDAYAYVDATDTWLDAGNVTGTTSEWKTVRQHPTDLSEWSRAEANGVAVYVWYDATNDITKATVVDVATDTILNDEQNIFADEVVAKCVPVGNYIFVVNTRASNNTIQARRFDTTDPTASPTAYTSVVSDVHATGYQKYDVIPYDDTKCVVVYQDTSQDINVFFLNDDGTASSSTQVVAALGAAPTGIALVKDNSNGVLIYVSEVVYRHDSSLTADWNESLSAYLTNATSATGVIDADGGSVWFVQDSTTERVQALRINSSGTYQSLTQISHYAPIASKGFLLNGLSCVCLYINSTLQPRYLVFTEEADIIADFLLNRAADPDPSDLTGLSAVQNVGGVFKFAVGIKQPDGTTFDRVALGVAEIDTNNNNLLGLEVDESIYLTGGSFRQWDSKEISEAGFYTFPEYDSDAQGSGGSIADGTYLYKAIFEYRDKRGKVYRSAPSASQSVTVSAGGGTATVDIDYKMHTFTNRANVDVVLYRTEAGLSTNYYRTATLRYPSEDSGDVVTITDSNSDATLASKELLYTVGGELENTLPPSSKSIAKWDQRIWLAGLPQPRDVWYSKILLDDEGAGFSETQVIRFPDDIVAVARLDSRLIAFSKTKIYYIHGEGGDATGAGSSYSTPQFISSDVGCVNRLSVAEIPDGVVFESHKGVYLIDRSMQLQYIGKAIESIIEASPTITSANVMEDSREVRFTTSNDKVYVWNYEFNQWSEFNYTGVDATVWKQKYTLIESDGTVKTEQTDFSDDGSFIAREIKTGWIHLAGIEGYKRVCKLIFTGNYVDAHQLDVYLAYNYDDTEVEQFTRTFDSSDDYSFEINPARHKCSAIRVRVVESSTGTIGESAALEALTLVVGVKRTEDKKPATNKTDGTSI